MSTTAAAFTRDVLRLDYAAAATEIEAALRTLTGRLHRRGLVLGVSGGIDSSVCAALAARALGPQRVRALLMPERDSSPSSLAKGKAVCEQAGIKYEVADLTASLESLGCYRKRDEAIRKVFPQFRAGDRFKIAVAQDVLNADRMNYFTLVVQMAVPLAEAVSMCSTTPSR